MFALLSSKNFITIRADIKYLLVILGVIEGRADCSITEVSNISTLNRHSLVVNTKLPSAKPPIAVKPAKT